MNRWEGGVVRKQCALVLHILSTRMLSSISPLTKISDSTVHSFTSGSNLHSPITQCLELTSCCSFLFCSIGPFPFVIFLAASVHLASLLVAWFGPPLPASETALSALLGVPTSHTRTPQGYRAVVASYLEDAPRLLILGLIPDVEVTRLIYFRSEQLTELYS